MDPPTYIPIPTRDAQPLRSAMKQPTSRPGTPQASPPAVLGSRNGSPFIPRPSTGGSVRSPNYATLPLPPSSPPTPHSPLPPTVPLPLAVGYAPKVSFDTFENAHASMFSYTLQVKTEGYARTRNTRVFLCAASPDASGVQALDWVLESLVQSGDELVVFRGVDTDALGESLLSPRFFWSHDLIVLSSERGHELCREEARELMRQIQEKNVASDSSRKVISSSAFLFL